MKESKEQEQENEFKSIENHENEKEFDKISKDISSLLDEDFEIPLDINKAKINSKNFIFTENALKKLKEIKYYISNNYPVLLEGPTGTAKLNQLKYYVKKWV